MEDRFQRLSILIGEDSLNKLGEKKVAVFGLGGVGGNVCDALARSGIKHFLLVDNDEVNITNINRQIIANENTIGRSKVDVMEEHLRSINPDIQVDKKKCFYLPENADEIDLSKYDYVVDAIDTVSAKIELICRCFSLKTPIISALGCGNKLNPEDLEVADLSKTSYDPLAKVLRRELKKRNITHLKVVYSKEKPITPLVKISDGKRKDVPGSSAFVPPVAGIIIASVVVKDLLN